MKRRNRKRKNKNGNLCEDSFSKELKNQGEDGKIMRMLYLRTPMDTYIKKVNDEPLSH